MDAASTVLKTISEHDLIKRGDHIVLGLSGGPDSLCLLYILHDVREAFSCTLSCVHVNHLMRGEQAEADVLWLSDVCAELNVPLSIVGFDVRKAAAEKRITVEEAGRAARHEALFAQAAKHKSAGIARVKVALAHNRDDQAETVLLRLLRGTGVRGLAAMEYHRSDGLIRPLLDTTRAQVEVFCEERALVPRWDSTNASRDYTRNRLRLDLIPLLETQYNPNIREVLVRLAQNAREDEQALQQLAHAHTDRAMPVADSAGCLSFPIDVLLEAGPAVGKRIVKLLFARIGLDADIAAVHLSALWTALFAKKTGSTIEFPGGYTAKIAYEAVLFCSPDQHFSQHALAGKTLQIEALPAAQAPGPFDLPPYQAVLDADKVEESGGALSMRTRRPGDRIYPLGGPGSKKLQDYFVDAKVPKHERDGWPLVCIGSEVLWVSGKTVSERFKVAPDTKRVLLLEIVDEI